MNMGGYAADCARIRQQSPIILNVTNIVAANFTANALLCSGASPLMVTEAEEMAGAAAIAASLVVNCGSVDKTQLKAMHCAASEASRLGKPWALDPAGAGVSSFRADAVRSLIEGFHPALIRGNASEILFLAGQDCHSHGVDSVSCSSEATQAAKTLARNCGAVVVVSGAVDYITDGTRLESLEGGNAMMARVTAMGCAATAICGAFLAVDSNVFEAAMNAMAYIGAAGADAAENSSGPGSFAAAFLDSLYRI